MPPINEISPDGPVMNGDHTEEGPRKFTFPSHQFHMVHLAKMCQENKDYTDCVIRVGKEELRAHRLVLGSVSPFLKLVFSDLPANHTEATILVPGVRQRVVKNLLDFFYTGQMTVDRQDTGDLQLLIDTLQIDPGLITVDTVENDDNESEPSRAARKRKAENDDDSDECSTSKKVHEDNENQDEEASK